MQLSTTQLSNCLYPRNDDTKKRTIKPLVFRRNALYLIAEIYVLYLMHEILEYT